MGSAFPQVATRIAYGIWQPVVWRMHAENVPNSSLAKDYAHYARPELAYARGEIDKTNMGFDAGPPAKLWAG
jgi:hypothetical protein